MKTTLLKNTAVLGLLTAASGWADSVTTLDHLSVNGVLTKMSGGTITLEARYAFGPKTLTIPVSTVEAIEFNSVAFNPGAPPKAYGLGPGVSPGAPAPKPPVATDAVELRGSNGERQPCKVASIDEGVVHCEAASSGKDKGKPMEYPRRIVLRILVGGGGGGR
jgi:hypothetical protein